VQRIGLVGQVAADEAELDQLVDKTVRQISKNSPAAVRACKPLIETVDSMSIAESANYVAGQIAVHL